MSERKAVLLSGNEFTKTFQFGDIQLFANRAFDEDANEGKGVHFILCGIPNIEELNVAHIQYPILFENEKARDEGFIHFDENFATQLLNNLIAEIKKRNEEVKKNTQE